VGCTYVEWSGRRDIILSLRLLGELRSKLSRDNSKQNREVSLIPAGKACLGRPRIRPSLMRLRLLVMLRSMIPRRKGAMKSTQSSTLVPGLTAESECLERNSTYKFNSAKIKGVYENGYKRSRNSCA
jgi:hypothetical protein